MRTKWNFFSPSLFFDEGPRSFFEYNYGNIRIVLIGEWHSSMSTKHAMPESFQKRYRDIFSEWMQACSQENKKSLIFAERREEESDSQNPKTLGFSDCIIQAKVFDGCQIVRADKRIMDDSLKSFGGFLYYIDDICREILTPSKSCNRKSIPSFALWNGKPLITQIKTLSSLLKKKIFLKDMEMHLEKQLDFIRDILDQCEEKYREIAPFIAECYCSLFNNSFEQFDAISAWCKERNADHESLDIICTRMIEEEGNLSPIDSWFQLFSGDMVPSLDASLVYRLWDEMHVENPADTIILVAGQDHIDNISKLADSLFTKIRTLSVSSDSSSIEPEQLGNFLFENQSKAKDKPCIIQ